MSLDISKITENPDEGYIKKANSLIQLNNYIGGREGQSLSLLSAKVFVFAISKIDQNAPNFEPVEFSIREFWEKCNIEPSTSKYYTLLADALKQVSDRSGWVSRVNPDTGKSEVVLVRLLEKPRFKDDGKTCVVRFDPDIAPALLMLKGNYTKYPLISALRLESKYGFALYELLCSYEYLHQDIRFSFEELGALLDATKYDRPSNFKCKVIDAAVRDINQHCSDIRIDYQIEKTGRQMSHVTFSVTRVTDSRPTEDETKPQDPAVAYEEAVQMVKEQIAYDDILATMQSWSGNQTPQAADLIVDILAGAFVSQQKRYAINGVQISTSKVRERFEALRYEHIVYVLDCLNKSQNIQNPKAFLRSVLYDAIISYEVYNASKQNKSANIMQPSGNLGEAELEAIRQVMKFDGNEAPND